MPIYKVYGILTGSVYLGEYEAENEDAAEDMADKDPANWMPSLCHQCSGEVEINDIYEVQVELVKE